MPDKIEILQRIRLKFRNWKSSFFRLCIPNWLMKALTSCKTISVTIAARICLQHTHRETETYRCLSICLYLPLACSVVCSVAHRACRSSRTKNAFKFAFLFISFYNVYFPCFLSPCAVFNVNTTTHTHAHWRTTNCCLHCAQFSFQRIFQWKSLTERAGNFRGVSRGSKRGSGSAFLGRRPRCA